MRKTPCISEPAKDLATCAVDSGHKFLLPMWKIVQCQSRRKKRQWADHQYLWPPKLEAKGGRGQGTILKGGKDLWKCTLVQKPKHRNFQGGTEHQNFQRGTRNCGCTSLMGMNMGTFDDFGWEKEILSVFLWVNLRDSEVSKITISPWKFGCSVFWPPLQRDAGERGEEESNWGGKRGEEVFWSTHTYCTLTLYNIILVTDPPLP